MVWHRRVKQNFPTFCKILITQAEKKILDILGIKQRVPSSQTGRQGYPCVREEATAERTLHHVFAPQTTPACGPTPHRSDALVDAPHPRQPIVQGAGGDDPIVAQRELPTVVSASSGINHV